MDAHLSISSWIDQLKAGKPAAAQALWEAYYLRMVKLARRKLGDRPRPVADEEDAAASAFKSFCIGVQKGRFPKLEDRNDLWQVLLMLTVRKAIKQIRADQAAKRGAGKRAHVDPDEFAEIVAPEPTPDSAALLLEELQLRLAGLHPIEQAVAVAKMEGYSDADIARQLGCSLSSVERKLRLIRRQWEKEGTG